jgi:hypothetical protein
MRVQDVDRFFEELDRRLKSPVRVILTGGAAGILGGVRRATLDIDFEVHPKGARRAQDWESLQKAIAETGRVMGITPEYADDIDRWSSIALPAKTSRLHRRIGKVEVRVLDPVLWAIGKLTRYLSSDIQDLRTVLKLAQVNPRSAVRVWGKALRISPPSTTQAAFCRQVESFLNQYAREIWGAKIDPEKLKALFLQSARGRR